MLRLGLDGWPLQGFLRNGNLKHSEGAGSASGNPTAVGDGVGTGDTKDDTQGRYASGRVLVREALEIILRRNRSASQEVRVVLEAPKGFLRRGGSFLSNPFGGDSTGNGMGWEIAMSPVSSVNSGGIYLDPWAGQIKEDITIWIKGCELSMLLGYTEEHMKRRQSVVLDIWFVEETGVVVEVDYGEILEATLKVCQSHSLLPLCCYCYDNPLFSFSFPCALRLRRHPPIGTLFSYNYLGFVWHHTISLYLPCLAGVSPLRNSNPQNFILSKDSFKTGFSLLVPVCPPARPSAKSPCGRGRHIPMRSQTQ